MVLARRKFGSRSKTKICSCCSSYDRAKNTFKTKKTANWTNKTPAQSSEAKQHDILIFFSLQIHPYNYPVGIRFPKTWSNHNKWSTIVVPQNNINNSNGGLKPIIIAYCRPSRLKIEVRLSITQLAGGLHRVVLAFATGAAFQIVCGDLHQDESAGGGVLYVLVEVVRSLC